MATPGAKKAVEYILRDWPTGDVAHREREGADLIDRLVLGPIRERIKNLLIEAEKEHVRLKDTIDVGLCLGQVTALTDVLAILNETEK